MTRRTVCGLVVGIAALLTYTLAEAQCFTDPSQFINFGNGVCDPGEAPGECTQLGSFVLEICPAPGTVKQFPTPSFCAGGPGLCSRWNYVLKKADGTTSGENQLSFLLPAPPAVQVLAVDDNGFQLYAPGAGDPSGFGLYDTSSQVLRIALSIGPSGFVTNLARPGLRAIVLKVGKDRFSGTILAASSTEIEPLTTTDRGFTDIRGRRLVVRTDIHGNVISAQAFAPDGSALTVTAVPFGNALFCLPSASSPTGFDCQPVVFVPDGTMIKTTGSGGTEDPCLSSGGRFFCY